jgi:hypothetical protein
MTFDIEIVLRERNYAVTDCLHTDSPPADWTDLDVEQLLKAMLTAIDRVKNPAAEERHVALRGFSWIVEPTADGPVIAIEMTTGAAVAGPFAVEAQRLDAMIGRVMAAAAPTRPTIH